MKVALFFSAQKLAFNFNVKGMWADLTSNSKGHVTFEINVQNVAPVSQARWWSEQAFSSDGSLGSSFEPRDIIFNYGFFTPH